jgi:hypothetical protein
MSEYAFMECNNFPSLQMHICPLTHILHLRMMKTGKGKE